MVDSDTGRIPLSFSALVLSRDAAVATVSTPAPASMAPTEHVILFVLEGFGQDSLKGGTMPTLSRLIKEGAVTWSATAVKPALRLPTMASLITGMPVEKHGITWNTFEFSRGYPRAPSVFDYLDLSGGRDSAIFLMDESLYQLARPEPYTDYQMCGPLKPECSTDRDRVLHPSILQESHQWPWLRACHPFAAAFPGRASS